MESGSATGSPRAIIAEVDTEKAAIEVGECHASGIVEQLLTNPETKSRSAP
ncbi:MAG: hypothetical protein MRJ92_01605 [Nitrospira sp.]|nr:hypothetical protein [Nitrospira sp.]